MYFNVGKGGRRGGDAGLGGRMRRDQTYNGDI